MLSNLCEVGGFGLITAAVYSLAGRSWAFVAAGVFLLVIGFGLEGTKVRLGAHIGSGLQWLGSRLRPVVVVDGDDYLGEDDD